MEREKNYLVITIIGKDGKVQNINHGEQERDKCPLVSFKEEESIVIPLWFDTEETAMAYTNKANANGTERKFHLIQEFTYKKKEKQDEAFLLFTVKSESCPTLDEGETEKEPGIWAHVRSFFICDRNAAEDYVRRFNVDAQKAFNYATRNNT